MEAEKKYINGKFDNDLINMAMIKFANKLTINQHKFLYYLIINEKNGNSMQGLTWKEIQQILNLTGDYKLNEKKKFIGELSQIQMSLDGGDNMIGFLTVIPTIYLKYNKLHYRINEDCTTLFEQPDIKYYLVEWEKIRYFKHDYSIMLYQLFEKEIHANQVGKKNLVFNLTWLKKYLGLEDHYNYKDGAKDFRIRVLEPSLMEISEYTDITIEGEYNKKTKKMQLSSKVWGQDKIMIGGVSRKSTMTEKMQEQKNNYDKKVIDGRTKEPTTSVEDNGFKLQPFQLTDNQSKFLSNLIHSNLIELSEILNIKSQEEFNDVFKRFYKRNDMSNNFVTPSFEPVEELKLDNGVDIDDLIENAYKPKKLDNNGSVATDNEESSVNNPVIDDVSTETDTKEIDKYVASDDYVLINTSTGKKLNNKKMYYTLKDKSKYKFITLKEYNFDAMKKKFSKKVTNRKGVDDEK